ncbi:hypothetical protein YC2023_050929 [Brassica napus]
MLLGPEGRFWSPEAALDPKISFRNRRLSEDPEVDGEPGGPRGHFGTRRSIGNPEVPLDPEVGFRTLRSFWDPEVDWEPRGEATIGTCWDFAFYRSETGHYRVPVLHASFCRKPLSDFGVLVMDSETQVPGFFCFPRLEKQEFMYCSLHVAVVLTSILRLIRPIPALSLIPIVIKQRSEPELRSRSQSSNFFMRVYGDQGLDRVRTWRRVIFSRWKTGVLMSTSRFWPCSKDSPSDVGFDGDGLPDASVSFDIRQLDTWSLDLYLFRRSSGRGAALETWRGTDPEFPREFVGAGDPGPGSGTWDPGPGIWDLEGLLSTDPDVGGDCPWSRGEPDFVEGRFQAGTGSRQEPETVEVILVD